MATSDKNTDVKSLEKRKPGMPPGLEHLPSTRKGKHQILQAIQSKIFERFGIVDWDPLVEMALYAADPDRVFIPMNENGKPMLDENGNVVTIEKIDPTLRQRCLEQVAQYVYPKLKSVELNAGTMGARFTLNYTVKVDGERHVDMGPVEGEESDV